MTKVKICGITNVDDALTAINAGADALGFNFYEKSPRYIAPATVENIIRKLPKKVMTVGVFVNHSLNEVERLVDETRIDRVQLHGDESPEFVRSIIDSLGPIVIKAMRLSGRFNSNMIGPYEKVEHFLLDSFSDRTYGGTGDVFDWTVALEFKSVHPDFYLAGGLTPENVADAIRSVRPFGVDVCSGVESSKGKKDPTKVAAFVRNARSAL